MYHSTHINQENKSRFFLRRADARKEAFYKQLKRLSCEQAFLGARVTFEIPIKENECGKMVNKSCENCQSFTEFPKGYNLFISETLEKVMETIASLRIAEPTSISIA